MTKNLSRKSTLLLLSLAYSAPAFAAPETYQLDPTHTNVVWSANHLGFSNPSGKFADVKGTLTLDEADPKNSRIEVTVNTASIVTGFTKFDEHLKSGDFFNVTAFPQAKFVSDSIEMNGEKTARVHGTLTMLGVSKPLVLETKLNKIGTNPMTQKKTAGFSATTVIKRSEYGINYAVPAVSDEVQMSIEAEAVADQAPAAPAAAAPATPQKN